MQNCEETGDDKTHILSAPCFSLFPENDVFPFGRFLTILFGPPHLIPRVLSVLPPLSLVELVACFFSASSSSSSL